jgi:hypothetical protein
VGAPADAIREFLQTLADPEMSLICAGHFRLMRILQPRFEQFLDGYALCQWLALQSSNQDLVGWVRVKFSSAVVDHTDLRIIYRTGLDGTELRAFGHRRDPESVYNRAAKRQCESSYDKIVPLCFTPQYGARRLMAR